MPLYVFACQECGQSFEKLMHSTDDASGVACPTCGSQEVKKKLSTFATGTSGRARAGKASGGGCSTGST